MSYPTGLPLTDAIRLVAARAPLTPPESVAIEAALGRVLADDLASRADHPTVDNSALDGYACRADDTLAATPDAPVRLTLLGESAAGGRFEGEVGVGQAIRIYTGAPLPAGADAIVPVEVTREEGDAVLIDRPGRREDIRPRGQDLERGRTYLERGERLDAAGVGLAAAMGYAEVPVRRRPRVGILATGDEVVRPGATLMTGQVYDANSFSVAALTRAAGAEPRLLKGVGDDVDALAAALSAGDGVDVLLTSGGVSMGRYDFVRDLLFDRGEVHFWKVAMRPGGPVLFGRWRDTPVLGLPGNPVSSMVVFLMLARAFIDTALGRRSPLPYRRRLTAIAAEPMRASGVKETFGRVRLEPRGDRLWASSTGNQSSGVLRSMADADALALLPPHAVVAEGEPLEVIPLAPHLG